MSKFNKVYDFILENCTEQKAIEMCNNIVWSEIETSIQNIKYNNYIGSFHGIELYYDYGADYYFFCESIK